MSKVKQIPLMKWLLLTMVAFMTFGTLFIYGNNVGSKVEANNYESVSLPMQIPTAYYDYRMNAALGGENEDAKAEFNRILNEHYGNVGLFVGPRDNSLFSSVIGTYHAPNSISLKPSDMNAMGLTGDARKNIESYHAFGRAIHDLSERGKGMTPSATNATESLDVIANTATGISRAGMKILIDYSPGPLIEQMYTGNKAFTVADGTFVESDGTAIAPGHKLIEMVQGNIIGDIWEALSMKPFGNSVSVTLTTLILGVVVVLLIIASVVMVIFGGRAGETIKKILVRVVVASVAVPAVGMLLHWGLVGAAAVTDYDISQEERDARNNLGKHLNLTGWAETGFMVPQGMTLTIKDGRFDLSQADIRTLNTLSFYMTKGDILGEVIDRDFLDGLPETGGEFSYAGIYHNMQSIGKDDKNKTTPHFSMRLDGDAKEVSEASSKLGSAQSSADGESEDDESDDTGGTESDRDTFSYMSKSNFANTMEYVSNPDAEEYQVIGSHGRSGISPISTYHLLYSDFSGNSIKAKKSNTSFTSVVYHADNGTGGTNADGSQAGTGMNSIVKFIAMITVAIASLKGLGQIFMGGFGGLVSGTARSAVGSSAGFGQAVGGAIALVGGVIGMSFIINISFELLNALYNVIQYLFKDVEGGADIMAPIADAIKDVMPWGFGWIGDAVKNLASFVISLIAVFALPKFGSIPIDMFSAKMAELPGNISERAQQMENRFTGDFRSGGGGGSRSGVGSAVNSALKGGSGQAKGLGQAGLAGLGMAAGLAGMGLSKVANRNNKEGDKNDNLSLSDVENKTDGTEKKEGDINAEEANNAVMSHSEVEQANEEKSELEAVETVEGGDIETVQDSAMESEQEIVQDSATETEVAENNDTVNNNEGQQETMHEQAGAEHESVQNTDTQSDKEGANQESIQNTDTQSDKEGANQESIQNTDVQSEKEGANEKSMHEATTNKEGGEQKTDSVHEQTGGEHATINKESAKHESSNLQEGGSLVNDTKVEQAGAETKTSSDTMNKQEGGISDSVNNLEKSSEATKNSDVKSVNDKTTNNAQSNTATNTTNSDSKVNTSSTPESSVSGEGVGTPSGGVNPTQGTNPTVAVGGQTVNTGQPSQQGKSGSSQQSVRNENKTNNQNNNQVNANSSMQGDMVIDKSVDTPSRGESMKQDAQPTGQASPSNPPGPGGPIDPSKNNGTVNKQPAPVEKTRAQKMVGAIKRAPNKAVGAAGKGLQAAGGEVTLKRAGAAILHAGASTIGQQDRTKGVLDKASGKNTQQSDTQTKQDTNKQQQKQNNINEQTYRHIQQQQWDEQEKQRKQKTDKPK